MSLEILLIPAAIAGYKVIREVRSARQAQGLAVCDVQTRMRDRGLLTAALTDTQAVIATDGDTLVARWEAVTASFSADDQEIWHATFTGDIDEERARAIVAAIDVAYGRRVQAAVVERLRQRAPAAGMSLVSEQVTDDDSVVLVLDLDRVELDGEVTA